MAQSNIILSKSVNAVALDTCVIFFNIFSEYYKLTPDQDKKAWAIFEEMRTLTIPLSLAINTAISLSKL